MPSRVVFPGGMLHEADYASEWQDIFQKVTQQTLEDVSRDLGTERSNVPLVSENRDWPVCADIAFRICAVRETFEESGILLATNQQTASNGSVLPYRSSSEIMAGDTRWRKAVEKDPAQFLTMCRELNVVPDVWSLKVWRNWLTPVFYKVPSAPKKPRRFDTMFFIGCFDCDELPNALADDSESTHADVGLPVCLL